ncbi:MAG: D-TA family PLP-dependent enzyme [Bacteroidetes bacterium]|nr:D-TA family PLP-dependent enzyme [Bacteroidota bacterium]
MWYEINNESSVFTPAILVYPDRIKENIRRMVTLAGDASRLRPHVKTHKMGEVVKLQLEQNITKFKAATLSELEMTAQNGGTDILLSYPLLGPDIQKYIDLIREYPNTKFSVTVDAFDACAQLTIAAVQNNICLDVFIDIDNGMHRTGALPEDALELATKINISEWLNLKGLHIYDGHIHVSDFETRKTACDNDFSDVSELVTRLQNLGIIAGELACGGTFSFPIHAKYPERTLCPGTPLLWDAGYKSSIPDLDFLNAAVLVGRVISKPNGNICFDLGHKAMAAEMPQPRLEFLDIDIQNIENQSEEHLVIKTSAFKNLELEDLVYALPKHICPTVALHEKVYVVNDNLATETWNVVARKRTF